MRCGRQNSAVFKHWADTGHDINFNSNSLVYKSGNLNNRLIVESALIKKLKTFNNTAGACSIDNLSSHLITSSNRNLRNNLNNL